MNAQKQYKTVLKEAVIEIEEKKSRFIASVKPACTEEEAVEFINSLKSKYWDATHNVYAYSIGGDRIVQRFSDDGEPSGTAGIPVLEVLKKRGLQDVVVVVTRYFGGTLLGASGLIRAYGKSASLGIEAAGVVIRQLCHETSVMVEYSLFGRIQNLLIREGYSIKDVIYGQDVEILVYVPVDKVEQFAEAVEEAANARAVLVVGTCGYIDLPEKAVEK
ncbi:MAG TPA: YigZ family protein [Clostridiales bacterium]|nr:YigZ family protein [Clostridiales bacterium]